MGMTRKQAKEYVADPKNWRLVEGTDSMSLYMLTAGEKKFAKLQVKMVDQFQLIVNKFVSTKWNTIGHYSLRRNGWIDGSVNVSEIENAVYEAAHAAAK